MESDVTNLDPNTLLDNLQLRDNNLDLLIGGPPCQAFSVFGRRKGNLDPRGSLIFEYLRLLAGLRPLAFVFENVFGILTVNGGSVFREVCDRLSNPTPSLHYQLSIIRLNAVNYSVPQFRDRIFIIGHLGGTRIDHIPFITSNQPSIFEQLPRYRTVRDALRDLPPIGSRDVPNHVGRRHSERIIKRYSELLPGQRDHFTRINKLDLCRPSFTIIVGSDKGGGKGHIHPIEPREVTPRESARIQTFPDWWAFSGTSRHPIRQVGNAVPPLLAAAIGNEIKFQLFGIPKTPFREVLRSLDQEHLYTDDISQ